MIVETQEWLLNGAAPFASSTRTRALELLCFLLFPSKSFRVGGDASVSLFAHAERFNAKIYAG